MLESFWFWAANPLMAVVILAFGLPTITHAVRASLTHISNHTTSKRFGVSPTSATKTADEPA